MKIDSEFETVDLLLKSDAKTKTVDAFCISYIKATRQIRKLFTYLVFQSPKFNKSHVKEIRNCIHENSRLYFKNFIKGFDKLSIQSVNHIVGEDYPKYMDKFDRFKSYRHKIFHGQLTDEKLSAKDLDSIIQEIRSWCKVLGENCYEIIGYDGFMRNSFQKSNKKLELKYQIESIEALNSLLEDVQR